MKMPQNAPMGLPRRISSESVWPLRDVNGKTWAERKRERTVGDVLAVGGGL